MSCQGKHHILEISHLSIDFLQYTTSMSREWVPSISDLSAYVHEGEVVAVVGSSGSGKSLLAHAVLGILPENARMEGRIFFEEEELTEEKKRGYRGDKIALIPQSVTSLDPLMKVGRQILGKKRGTQKDRERRERLRALFERYNLAKEVENFYPHECSGGMLRRVLLCTALIENPRLIIADEPTTGMDRALAEQAMEDFRAFAAKGKGVLLITHDLELAVRTADRIVVFYAGTTLEEALSSDFGDERLLRHPYTKALWRALPEHDFVSVPGSQPLGAGHDGGCVYMPRCPLADDRCRGTIEFRTVDCGSVRCVRGGREDEPEGRETHLFL